jgi:hypothetical protein
MSINCLFFTSRFLPVQQNCFMIGIESLLGAIRISGWDWQPDKTDHLPFHRQIHLQIRNKICAGPWPVETSLPQLAAARKKLAGCCHNHYL